MPVLASPAGARFSARMSYDPFVRGTLPVGVRTLHASDAARDGRALPIEV